MDLKILIARGEKNGDRRRRRGLFSFSFALTRYLFLSLLNNTIQYNSRAFFDKRLAQEVPGDSLGEVRF